jgi:hypothetical protein
LRSASSLSELARWRRLTNTSETLILSKSKILELVWCMQAVCSNWIASKRLLWFWISCRKITSSPSRSTFYSLSPMSWIQIPFLPSNISRSPSLKEWEIFI